MQSLQTVSVSNAAREPSMGLLSLLKTAAETLYSFGNTWAQIQKLGEKEGFSEEELRKQLSDFIRARLPTITPRQLKNKVYYLTHTEEQKERVKENKVTKDKDLNIVTNKPKSPSVYNCDFENFNSERDAAEHYFKKSKEVQGFTSADNLVGQVRKNVKLQDAINELLDCRRRQVLVLAEFYWKEDQ